MTWISWRVSPFITSIFFILGVFTLYEVLIDWIKSKIKINKFNLNEHFIESLFGILYMLIFIFSMQASIVGRSVSWQFMNFQIIALIFCAYFLNIHVPYYVFIPIVLIYMVFNSSINYWQSWCHGFTLMFFYWSMYYVYTWSQNKKYPFLYYIDTGVLFGGLLWFFVKIKFGFSWQVLVEQWFYLIIFEVLLYSYVRMLFREDRLKLHLTESATHDALTKSLNYAAYESEIKYLFENYQENNLNLSMMMIDIDHFKSVNDTYGHLSGDQVLQHVVDVVQTVINANDSKVKLYRTGGEEFNIIFPDYDLESAKIFVKEIFNALNHLQVNLVNQRINISVSVGVSEISKHDITPNDFYSRVDSNLYQSKKNGRMQITAK